MQGIYDPDLPARPVPALITMDEACLWVDGRYYVQAAAQLKDSTVTMMKMGQEGVPSLGAYLEDKMPEGGCLGFDGRVVNAAEGLALEEMLRERGARISYGEDLAGMIWQERPELSAELHGFWMRGMRERAHWIRSRM